MATYVLIHGGSHGGWCYDRVAPLLRAAGHVIYAPTLTGLSDRKHLLTSDVNLDTHLNDVANLIYYHDLKDVILLGHSYGGIVITGAADRVVDRIGQLVYLDAVHARNGESLGDYVPGAMEIMRAGMREVDGVELINFPSAEALKHYGVSEPADIEWALPRLTPHPWNTCVQKLDLKNDEAVRAIHKVSINCSETIRNPHPAFSQRVFEADQLFEIEGGHDVMISNPKGLAEILLQLA